MKHKILGWLFKRYARELRNDANRSVELQIEAFKATLDVKDIIRERLKGVRPNHPDDGTILQEYLANLDDPSRLGFLSKAHDIVENETYKKVVQSLIVQSEHDAMMNATDMTEVNFNRATINGLVLIEEELAVLDKMYQDEQELAKKMTDAERQSIL